MGGWDMCDCYLLKIAMGEKCQWLFDCYLLMIAMGKSVYDWLLSTEDSNQWMGYVLLLSPEDSNR